MPARRIIKKTSLFFGLFLLLAVFSPRYLLYADAPVRSNAIVLFIGPDFDNREKEALSLMADGYAEWLIIPGSNKILKRTSSEKPGIATHQEPPVGPFLRADTPSEPHRLIEDTHLEIQSAQRIMNRLKISSALFVSSPYHMRRIKLISDAVLQNSGAAIAFVPSRFEKKHPLTWWLRPAEIVWVGSEFAKIAWFILYHHGGLIPTANG